VRTWVQAARLTAKLKEANAIQDADGKRGFVRKEVLPLRVDIARGYENMIAAFVNCAKSPGEIGTIASIESGSREGIVSSQDEVIGHILGEPCLQKPRSARPTGGCHGFLYRPDARRRRSASRRKSGPSCCQARSAAA